MKRSAVCVLALSVLALSGCIRHRVIITSEPTEAMVWWNNEYRGRTPIEIPFIYHWKYKVDVEKEGYQKLTSIEHLRTRPWFIAPMGLICELLPFKITDTRHLHYTLEKKEGL